MKTDTEKLWVAVDKINEGITDIKVQTRETHTMLKAHMDNKAIHHSPPCDSVRNLSAKLWGLAVLGGAGLVKAFWGTLK